GTKRRPANVSDGSFVSVARLLSRVIDARKRDVGFGPRARRFHKGWIDRPANPLTKLEGGPAITTGGEACHGVGRPNAAGWFGSGTPCQARHAASIALAREPTTCGQCHMGPDHSQIEIQGISVTVARARVTLRSRSTRERVGERVSEGAGARGASCDIRVP